MRLLRCAAVARTLALSGARPRCAVYTPRHECTALYIPIGVHHVKVILLYQTSDFPVRYHQFCLCWVPFPGPTAPRRPRYGFLQKLTSVNLLASLSLLFAPATRPLRLLLTPLISCPSLRTPAVSSRFYRYVHRFPGECASLKPLALGHPLRNHCFRPARVRIPRDGDSTLAWLSGPLDFRRKSFVTASLVGKIRFAVNPTISRTACTSHFIVDTLKKRG